ncbi:MAG: hypothetical protein ABFD18_09465 [Syntrophomonas sp.]
MDEKKTVSDWILDRVKFEVGQEIGIINKKPQKIKKNINNS